MIIMNATMVSKIIIYIYYTIFNIFNDDAVHGNNNNADFDDFNII